MFGAHGTGKTTILDNIKKMHPEYFYIKEPIRHQTTAFGYKTPWEIEKEVTEAVYEIMNMNFFSVIDKECNPYLKPEKTVIIDRSPIDVYAYYLAERKEKLDYKIENLLKNMALYYNGLIDLFVYFPIGKIPLIGDEMRPDDPKYQKKVDKYMKKSIKELNVPNDKIYTLNSISIGDRVNEVLHQINK